MAQELEKIFQALGNKARLDIIRLILAKKEIPCQDVLKKFTLSQPTMSHHLKVLIDSGVLAVRREGVRHFYRVDSQKLDSVGINLDKIRR